MQNLIRLVKSNSDNNLILLKELIRLKQQVEKLELEFPKKAREFIQGGNDVV